MKYKSALVLFFISAVTFVALSAYGNPFEIYSASPRIAALGGAGTAAADDGYAAYYNPALLATSKSAKFTLGFTGASHYFKTGRDELTEDADVPFYSAVETSLLYPLPFKKFLKNRLALGVVASLPTKHILNITKQDSNDIVFPFYDDRMQRPVFSGGLSIKLFDWLSIGGGLLLLPKVEADIEVDFALEKENIYNATGIETDYSLAPTAGVLAMPFDWMKFGASYRGGQTVDINLPIWVNDPPAHAKLTIPAFYTPHEISAGFAFQAPYALTVLADVTYYTYENYESAFPSVSLLGSEADKVINKAAPDDGWYRNIIIPRAGVEWSYIQPLSFRLGFSYRPTPISEQVGNDNLMDGDSLSASAGFGVLIKGLGDYFPADLRLDFSSRYIYMPEILAEKEVFNVHNAGFPAVRAGGSAVSFGLACTVLFH